MARTRRVDCSDPGIRRIRRGRGFRYEREDTDVYDRVLGCASRMLDLGFFRVGGEEYLADNSTYGLTHHGQP